MTDSAGAVPAAQYLRMSTEHQQYSIHNQNEAIRQYAEKHGFTIVQSYSDAARTGLVLSKRKGLQSLLRDIVTGIASYKVILVYDVSRWGRFQDSDESAHYEYLCKAAGIPVHYCAETFQNDSGMASFIMKSLKRTMAGEYSRELSAKVFAGQIHCAGLGYKMGGAPGYGLRRMLVSKDTRSPKQLLASGERKSLATDRVILVPGPAQEVACVREIYRLLVKEGRSVWWISQELQRRGLRHVNNAPWRYSAVLQVLTHAKYAGCNVYGTRTQKLSTPVRRQPKSKWVVVPNAFESIVSLETFEAAQHILEARTCHQSDEVILDGLRALWARKGRLSQALIHECPELPSPSTYRYRFGSLKHAFELIGYGQPEQFGIVDTRRRTMALRDRLIERFEALFPSEIVAVRRGGMRRPRLRLRYGLLVTVLMSRAIRIRGLLRWLVDPIKEDRRRTTLLVRLDTTNQNIQDMFVVPGIDRPKKFTIKIDDEWLGRGERVSELSHLCEIVSRVRQLRR